MSRPRPPATPASAVAPEVARARHLMLGLYALLGVTVATWLSRLPTVRTSLGLSTGELGVVLLVGAVGSLATVLTAGAVAQRFGNRRVLLASGAAHAVAFALLGLASAVGSVPVLVLGVVSMTGSFALGNVPLNVETATIERRMGRTVVPHFHAAFSFGSILGSGLGAVMAWAGVPPVVHFVAVAAVALVWRLRAIPDAVLQPDPVVASAAGGTGAPAPRGAGFRRSLAAWRERRTLLVGVIVMAAALSEGSANTWLAIGVVDGFGASDAVGAVVFGVFVAAMTVARVAGTGLLDSFGRVAVLAGSAVASLGGLLAFGLGPSLAAAALGAAAWGLGAGLAVPIGMVAVSEDPMRAAGRVAVVSAFASVASLAAPPLLGLAAEHLGVRHALLLIAVGMVASGLLSGQVRPTASRAPEGGGDPLVRDVEDELDAGVVPDTLASLDEARTGSGVR